MDSLDLFMEEERRREKLRDPLLSEVEDAFDEKMDATPGPELDKLQASNFSRMKRPLKS